MHANMIGSHETRLLVVLLVRFLQELIVTSLLFLAFIEAPLLLFLHFVEAPVELQLVTPDGRSHCDIAKQHDQKHENEQDEEDREEQARDGSLVSLGPDVLLALVELALANMPFPALACHEYSSEATDQK
jgi:hypothetical protein